MTNRFRVYTNPDLTEVEPPSGANHRTRQCDGPHCRRGHLCYALLVEWPSEGGEFRAV